LAIKPSARPSSGPLCSRRSYLALSPADQTAQAKAQRDASALGLKLLDEVKKPERRNDQAFTDSKRTYAILFTTPRSSGYFAKDFAAALALQSQFWPRAR